MEKVFAFMSTAEIFPWNGIGRITAAEADGDADAFAAGVALAEAEAAGEGDGVAPAASVFFARADAVNGSARVIVATQAAVRRDEDFFMVCGLGATARVIDARGERLFVVLDLLG